MYLYYASFNLADDDINIEFPGLDGAFTFGADMHTHCTRRKSYWQAGLSMQKMMKRKFQHHCSLLKLVFQRMIC